MCDYWRHWVMIQVLCQWHCPQWTQIAMEKEISLTVSCFTVNPTTHWPLACLHGREEGCKTMWMFGTELLQRRYSLLLFSRLETTSYPLQKEAPLEMSASPTLHPYLRRVCAYNLRMLPRLSIQVTFTVEIGSSPRYAYVYSFFPLRISDTFNVINIIVLLDSPFISVEVQP